MTKHKACPSSTLYHTINLGLVQIESICGQQITKLKFVLGRVENIVGKGENAGYQKQIQSLDLNTVSGLKILSFG